MKESQGGTRRERNEGYTRSRKFDDERIDHLNIFIYKIFLHTQIFNFYLMHFCRLDDKHENKSSLT